MNLQKNSKSKEAEVEQLEPAGGFEHPICRLQFGRSSIELHRLIYNILCLCHFDCVLIPFCTGPNQNGDHIRGEKAH